MKIYRQNISDEVIKTNIVKLLKNLVRVLESEHFFQMILPAIVILEFVSEKFKSEVDKFFEKLADLFVACLLSSKTDRESVESIKSLICLNCRTFYNVEGFLAKA